MNNPVIRSIFFVCLFISFSCLLDTIFLFCAPCNYWQAPETMTTPLENISSFCTVHPKLWEKKNLRFKSTTFFDCGCMQADCFGEYEKQAVLLKTSFRKPSKLLSYYGIGLRVLCWAIGHLELASCAHNSLDRSGFTRMTDCIHVLIALAKEMQKP